MRIAYEGAARTIVGACEGPVRPVVLVDGGSGSGKTSLAAAVGRLWDGPLQVVSLDAVYPGWAGLAAASEAVPTMVGRTDPGYRGWDWIRNTPTDWVSLDPALPILVEGCGALTQQSAPLATLTVWLDLDADHRKSRALARDDGGFDPYWDMWAAQEQEHWRRNRPWDLADLVVAGTTDSNL